MARADRGTESSPYLDFHRNDWKQRRAGVPQVLTAQEVEQLSGIGENLDLAEVEEIYLPLSRLIHLQVRARQNLIRSTEAFIGGDPGPDSVTPRPLRTMCEVVRSGGGGG